MRKIFSTIVSLGYLVVLFNCQGKTGDPVIPLGLKLPVATLDPGSYRVELRAGDTVGNNSKTRNVSRVRVEPLS